MRFHQDKENFNGNVSGGQSSSLVTKDDEDNVLVAAPVPTGGLSASFNVPDPTVVGLEMLFNADSIVGSDGDVVTTWIDTSGNNRTATTFAGTPTLKKGVNGINGHNIVRFADGTAESCEMRPPQLDVRGWSGISVYYIARCGTGTAWGGVFGWNATGQWLNIAVGNHTDGQGAGWYGNGTPGFGDLSPPFAAGNVRYGSYRYDKDLWTVDGANTSTHADTSWPSATVVPLIGSNTYPGSQSDNDYYEIRVYSRKLTDAEDDQVKSYMQWKAGIVSSPVRALLVGYPETITNYFSERFVHPSGNDAWDGKTWQTAKQTVLAAWDSAVLESPSGFTLHVEHGSYIGGEVPSQGLWLTTETVSAGWRQNRSYRIIGYGGGPPGRGFTFNKAGIYQGRPGDSQAFDTTKPLIWIEGSGVPGEISNIAPINYGFARLAVKRGGTRDGNLEDQRWHNVLMTSPPDTDPVFGPAYDCGWINECTFDNCQAAGAARYRDVTVAPGDGASAAGQTITLTNGGFDSTYEGGYLVIVGGLNEGQWFISHVSVAPTTVVIANTNGRVLVDETFTTQSVQKIQGPQIIDDDNHAGWLFKPTAPSGGDVGSMGTVLFTGITSTQQTGIKYYVGNNGEIGLFIDYMITEGGPQPHPIQIKLQPGQTIPSLSGSNTSVRFGDIGVADGYTFDSLNIIADDSIKGRFGVGTLSTELVSGGASGVAGLWRGSDAAARGLLTTPTTARQYGWFHGGRLTGNHDAGRRIGAPAAALPSSSGATGSHVTNLIDDNPGNWSANGGATITKNTPDPFGLTNGAQIGAGSGFGYILLPQSASAPATTALDVGDFVVAGVWTRAPGGPNVGSIPLVLTSLDGADAAQLLLQPTWVGNAQWEFQCGYTTVTHAGTASFSLQPGQSASAVQVAYPVVAVFKLSDGYTEEWVAELTAHLATWNPNLAQGSVGTLRGQPFVGNGGLGVDSSVLVTPSGTSTQASNLPVFGADGRTVIAWVPTIGSNKKLIDAQAWPPADEVVTSTGSGPQGSTGFTYTLASGLLKVGGTVEVDGVTASKIIATDSSHQLVPVTVDPTLSYSGGTLERAALTGDVTAAAGSNTTALAALGTAGTYGAANFVIRSVTTDAKGRVTSVTTSNKPQSCAFNFSMSAVGMSVGYNKSSIILPVNAGAASQIVSTVAGTSETTTMSALWATTQAPPLYPLFDEYGGYDFNVNVGLAAGSGSGSATLRFNLYSVVTDPTSAGNFTQKGTCQMTGITTSFAGSFMTLGFTGTAWPTNASFVVAVFRDDVNNLFTLTDLTFSAVLRFWGTPI